jgi:hypothetical protein
LLVLLAFTLIAALVVLVDAFAAMRVIFAVPLVLLAPGYAVTAALFPDPVIRLPTVLRVNPTGTIERLLLSLGLSLAVASLGGLLLNLTPSGLQVQSWLLLLEGVTIGASVIALLRRERHPVSEPALVLPIPSPSQLLLLTAGIAITAGAIWVSRVGAETQQYGGFTQLWILPAGQDMVRYGVRNMEQAREGYRLRIGVSGVARQRWQSITLAPGASWKATMRLPRSHVAPETVNIRLYRTDRPNAIYRHVRLQLGSTVKGPR